MLQKTLYNDEIGTAALEGEADARLKSYINEIRKNTELVRGSVNAASMWYRFAKSLISKIMFDVLEDYGINSNLLNFQLYICGSLAKQQATPYSDFDGFIIWEEPDTEEKKQELEKIKTALAGMQQLFHRIFEKTSQFCPDPLGITPFRYHGTVNELYGKLESGAVADVEAFIGSITTARPVLADNSLLIDLTNKIQFGPIEEVQDSDLYKKIIEDFPGPLDRKSIHIKRDIFRPFDFFVMLLRKDYGIQEADGSHLQTSAVILELIEKGKMSHEFGELLLSIFNDAIKLRFAKHMDARKEDDMISFEDLTPDNRKLLRQLIDKMAIVRGVAHQRQQLSLQGNNLAETELEFTNIANIPYLTGSYTKEELTLDVTPYVYSDPAREYFEDQKPQMRANLAGLDLANNGAIETIFRGIEKVPPHLHYVCDSLTHCFKNVEVENGQIFRGDILELDQTKFKVWCQGFLQNLIGDLFDKEANLHPWIKRLIKSAQTSALDLGQTNSGQYSPRIDESKKALLRAYFNNVVHNVIKSHPLIKDMQPEAVEENTKIWTIINNGINNTITKIDRTPLLTLITERQVPFTRALKEFGDTVRSSIDLLTQVQESTLDQNLINKISVRKARYEELHANITAVKVATEKKNTLQSSFLHKSYHFFVNDFNEFQDDLRLHHTDRWTQFKEGFLNITKQLLASVGLMNKPISSNERVSTIEALIIRAKRKYEISATAGGYSDEGQKEELRHSSFPRK